MVLLHGHPPAWFSPCSGSCWLEVWICAHAVPLRTAPVSCVCSAIGVSLQLKYITHFLLTSISRFDSLHLGIQLTLLLFLAWREIALAIHHSSSETEASAMISSQAPSTHSFTEGLHHILYTESIHTLKNICLKKRTVCEIG